MSGQETQKEESLTPNQQIEKLKVKTSCIESEIHSAREAGEVEIVETARSRSKLRRLGEKFEETTKNYDSEIQKLEWTLELANQDKAKLEEKIDIAKSNLESTISKYAQQLQQKKTEYAEQEALLRSELLMYQTELDTLREFQGQRAQMEEELRQLDKTLVEQRTLHAEKMEQLRQQLSREKKHFEDENRKRVREAERAAVHIRDECLEAAAIKCIQDSQAVTAQLKKNQLKSNDILVANAELTKKIDDMMRENQLLDDRKKILEKDVAKYRRKMDNLKQQISENEVQFAKERAKIEAESAATIKDLTQQCDDVERENYSLQKHLNFLTKRLESTEGQRKMTSTDMQQLIGLITSTAPYVLDSLKASNQGDKPEPLQALITKLSEAVGDAD